MTSIHPLKSTAEMPERMDAFLESRSVVIARLLRQASQHVQQQVLDEVRQGLTQFEGPQGLVTSATPCLAWEPNKF